MTADPFGAPSHGDLFADPEARELLSDARRVAAMVRVEAALARAQAACGVIPQESADTIAQAADGFEADAAALGKGTESAGVPVPSLVAQLRAAVGGDAATHVHWGATSQDILDTALVLVLRDVLERFDAQLARLADGLSAMAREHAGTLMLARTRLQQAAPTTFGLKVAGWRAPIVRHRERLAELRKRLLVVQLGGAAGTLAPLRGQGPDVRAALAKELGLSDAALPWHVQRDAVAELAGWLSLVTGSLGKMGLDVGLLAQSEVGEVRESGEAGKGGSSTLPQKSNPVGSEVLVTLARYNAHQVGAMHSAMVQDGERSGAAWSLEWLVLPNMILAASGAFLHAIRIVDNLVVDTGRMRANIEATNGLCLAEAVSFALSEHLPREEAQALVSEACRTCVAEGRHLVDVVSKASDAPVDWDRVRDPANWTGTASRSVEDALGLS
ncbi:MAG: 3-carboxy-cis,cis-muconate cycloisomerase [Alphaproteobacteria bacterium]|nr:3-carboxy-cis,cis-muconate cycloisomerase [Alphaproteobacteria bacterium]